MILTGLIRNIFPEETYGKFRKTVLWLQEINSQYPNTWQIEFWNDDGKWLKGYSTGVLVNVNIAVLGRLNTKNGQEVVYNTVRGVKIQRVQSNSNKNG